MYVHSPDHSSIGTTLLALWARNSNYQIPNSNENLKFENSLKIENWSFENSCPKDKLCLFVS